jgi:hypothetical protein
MRVAASPLASAFDAWVISPSDWVRQSPRADHRLNIAEFGQATTSI